MYSTRISHTLRRIAPALLLLSASACGLLHRNREEAPGTGPAQLYFRNDALDQATVYVTASGVDFQRIGTVMPGRTDTLLVAESLINRGGQINIVARILARSNLVSTGPVTVGLGEAYDVHLFSDEKTMSFLPARE